jgi:hypothetical protein
MDEANAKAESKDDEADGVHRLRDIVVEEVSLVDRAANKRRFLVVKRSGDMADESNADSDVEKAKKKPAAASEVEDEEKRKKPGADEEDDDAEKAARPSDDEEDDDEKTEKARTPSADEETEDGEKTPKRKQALAMPAAVKDALLRSLTEALERLMAIANRVKEATAPEDAEAEAALPDDVASEIAAIAELLASVGKRKAAKADVAKAGARMAKDRLDRFQKAMALLADILKELTDSKEGPAAPSAGAAEAGVKKRDIAAPPAIPGIAELVTGIGELTRVVKRQEEELARIRQARGVSNAIPVESARRAEPQEVSWPLDMNRPISRDKVKKEVSFFDE